MHGFEYSGGRHTYTHTHIQIKHYSLIIVDDDRLNT